MTAALLTVAAIGAAAGPALAQSWWPFGNNEPKRPPVPHEPVYRQPAPYPADQAAPGATPAPGPGAWASKNPICLQLEQKLVQESQRGSQTRDLLPRIESDIRVADQNFQRTQAQIDRGNCYEYFLFSKTFNRTPRCVGYANELEGARRRLQELQVQRQQIVASGGRSYQDDIVRELARNNCGQSYQQQASRSGEGSFWQDGESGIFGGGSWNNYGPQSYATYRTICVRLCDGYYFPVSFSTLPNHFEQDQQVCASKCAAPVALYYHQNPGGAVEQAVSVTEQMPYTQLKSAFRYRKEFVAGCSCKEAEYVPNSGEGPAQKQGAAPAAGKRADAAGPSSSASEPQRGPSDITTGSTTPPAPAAPPAAAPAPEPDDGWGATTSDGDGQ